jgi:hypothetical protein
MDYVFLQSRIVSFRSLDVPVPIASPGHGDKFVSEQRVAAWRQHGGSGITDKFHGLFVFRFDFPVAIARNLPVSLLR